VPIPAEERSPCGQESLAGLLREPLRAPPTVSKSFLQFSSPRPNRSFRFFVTRAGSFPSPSGEGFLSISVASCRRRPTRKLPHRPSDPRGSFFYILRKTACFLLRPRPFLERGFTEPPGCIGRYTSTPREVSAWGTGVFVDVFRSPNVLATPPHVLAFPPFCDRFRNSFFASFSCPPGTGEDSCASLTPTVSVLPVFLVRFLQLLVLPSAAHAAYYRWQRLVLFHEARRNSSCCANLLQQVPPCFPCNRGPEGRFLPPSLSKSRGKVSSGPPSFRPFLIECFPTRGFVGIQDLLPCLPQRDGGRHTAEWMDSFATHSEAFLRSSAERMLSPG